MCSFIDFIYRHETIKTYKLNICNVDSYCDSILVLIKRVSLQDVIPDEKTWWGSRLKVIWDVLWGTLGGIKGGTFSAELPLTILPSILPSFVHLLLPSLVWPFTPPWRLQQLLEEREREEREEVVEEVEDARFVRASTLLLPFPSFASPNSAFYFTFSLFCAGIFPHLEWDSLPYKHFPSIKQFFTM